jgi:CRISPR-associated protein Cas2
MHFRRIIVSYDVVSNARRAKLSKFLKGHLERVQKSVFEGEIGDRRYEALKQDIAKQINQEEDTVRIYTLCERCVASVDIVGTGVYIEREDEDIVV